MLAGSIRIEGDTVRTHHTSYDLGSVVAVSARRPFLVPSLIVGGGTVLWAAMFWDLLFPVEAYVSFAAGFTLLVLGFVTGQLKLHSLALRGNDEVSSVLYGTYSHLNRVRTEIDARLAEQRLGSE